jgi:hypothetical protein
VDCTLRLLLRDHLRDRHVLLHDHLRERHLSQILHQLALSPALL